jgi:hypothetical protein
MLIGGLLTADAVACMLAVIVHFLRVCGLGLRVPGTRLIPVSFRHRLPRWATSRSRVDTCWGETSGWLRGQAEVSRCVLSTHCMVRTRAAVGRRCTHRTSAAQKSSSRAPHRLLAPAGGYMECLGIQCVFCRSDPPSHPRGVSIQLAGLRYALSMERPVVCRACVTDIHRTCMLLCCLPARSCIVRPPKPFVFGRVLD